MKYLDEIVKELLNGTFSVFCGAGADFDATRKNWIDIFSEKTQGFYKKGVTDIYFLADLEKRYHNADLFFDDICKNLNSVSDKESEHINNIINLNINQIWTTNFDSIIENTINRKLGFYPTIIKESSDLFTEDLHAKYLVYKLNGSIEKQDTMVLTKSDFLGYFKKQRLIFEMLKRQLVLDSFLFIGYSFTDDLVLNALREIKEVFPKRGKSHYRFLIKQSKNYISDEFHRLESKYYYDEYNIKTIYLEHFEDIDNYLQNLYERFCNHNILISGSFRHLKNNHERMFIENLINSLIHTLTSNGFNIYSGNGRGLGEIVVAQINKCSAEAHFVNRPLIFTNDTEEQKKAKNNMIMKDCDTMLVICGQDDTLQSSRNVINQFKAFLNNNHDDKKLPIVIPIPTTGYAAQEIFDSDDFKNSNFYLSNKTVLDSLKEERNIQSIVHIVVNLIMSYKSEKQ